MSRPRSLLVDETGTRWHHCLSHGVRRARLGGDRCNHRKDWIVARLRKLIEVFAIHYGGFAGRNA